MDLEQLSIQDSYLVKEHSVEDSRGSFERIFDDKKMQGIEYNGIRNVNLSRNLSKGTIRGLHMQTGNASESKIISCVKGKIIDLYVDCRLNSKTFGLINTVILNENEPNLLIVPKGCLHSFLTIDDSSEVLYLTDNYYYPKKEIVVSPFSKELSTYWDPYQLLVSSEKDRSALPLDDYLKSIS